MKKEILIKGIPFTKETRKEDKDVFISLDFLKNKYDDGYSFGIDNLLCGYYREMGYHYDVTPYFKKYLYKQYGQWHEVYSPNKGALRKVTYGRIEKIVDITNK